MEDFFESSSPADYVKELINIKNPDENKETVAKIEDRISDLKEKIKKWVKQKKNKNADETLKIIEKILDYNKDAQKIFQHASKVGKGKPKPEESIAERTILRKEKVAEIEKKQNKT